MGNYGITGWSGGSRQSLTYNLKAGQFRGMGRVNVYPSRTTIINNNIIGGGIYADHHCCDSGTPKWMKWMMGIGLGTTFLGSILNAFGIGGGGGTVEGAGGKAPETNNQYKSLQDQIDELKAENEKLQKRLGQTQPTKVETSTATPAPVTTPKTETPTVQEQPKVDYSYIANGKTMVCTDASGRTKDISGTLSNVTTDANGVPQSFTLTDSSSGNKYNYEVRVGKDGSLTYECVSKNGHATIGAPNYTLKNGQLVNEQGQNGHGIGIRTQSRGPQNIKENNSEVPEETLKDQVSNSFSSLTPYFHVEDGKYHAVPDNNHSYRDMSLSSSTKTADEVKTTLENSKAFKEAGGKDVKITKNSDGTFTATFKVPGGERRLSGAALEKFIEEA